VVNHWKFGQQVCPLWKYISIPVVLKKLRKFYGRWVCMSSALNLINQGKWIGIERVMACLRKTIRAGAVRDSLNNLGFLTLVWGGNEKTLNIWILVDRMTLLEWVKLLDFDIRISRRGFGYFSLDSDLQWILMQSLF